MKFFERFRKPVTTETRQPGEREALVPPEPRHESLATPPNTAGTMETLIRDQAAAAQSEAERQRRIDEIHRDLKSSSEHGAQQM